jgi:hypothetical protein
MSTRSEELVTGRQFYLQVQKSISGTPTFVTVGCANSVDYGGQSEILTANCYNGKTKIVSGDDPDYSVTLQGFYFIYATANVNANISAKEFEELFQAKTRTLFKLASPHTGDPVRSFGGYINDFKLTGEVNGLVTYSVGIMVDGVPVLSSQT